MGKSIEYYIERELRKPDWNKVILGSLFVILMGLILYDHIYPPKAENGAFRIYPTVENTEQRIDSATTVIHHHETTVFNEKKIIEAIHTDIGELREELEAFKLQKDTFQIVQIQDTLIEYLTDENKHLYKVVDHQDSIIQAQRFVINQKDTIISILNYNFEQDIKKVKKQRNIAVLLSIFEGGVIIFKK